MNILFLTLIDFNSLEEKNIYTDLMREFIKNNHRVYIVSPTERRKNQPTRLIDYKEYKILKIQIGNVLNTNLIEKGISTLTLEDKFKRVIKEHYADVKFDLVMYTTPPITLKKPIEYVKKRDGAKAYLLLKDIFPQNAVDLGLMKTTGLKGIIYKHFRKKEIKLYALSDYIGCMSKANVDYVLKHNPSLREKTVEVCPNSIETFRVNKDPVRITDTRKSFDIPIEKTVFLYGGNLGVPQGIDFLIECLEANKDNEQAYFIIVGIGTEFNKLKAYFDNEKPKNAQLIPYLPKEDYDSLAASCDVGLIFLDSRFTIPNFPSRLLSYMNASIPVLAATDVNTDIGAVIEEGNFGFWCESTKVEDFSNKLNRLCNAELRSVMGANGKRYLEENYTVKHSYDIIMKNFKDKGRD